MTLTVDFAAGNFSHRLGILYEKKAECLASK
jgi:hypothetical protein